MEKCGFWNEGALIELVRVNGELYALHGWNGEAYTGCWKCIDPWTADADDRCYTLRPIYRFERENIGLERLEENSPEWDAAVEVVDYDIYLS